MSWLLASAAGCDGCAPAPEAVPRPCADDPWASVAAGNWYVCGIHPDGCAECWGYGDWADGSVDTGEYMSDYGTQTPPAVPLVRMDILGSGWGEDGDYHACAITMDEQAVCWGRNAVGEAEPPEGTFSEIAVSQYGSCGLSIDGEVSCWGAGYPSGWDYPEASGLHQLMGEEYYFAALDSTGEAQIWGPEVLPSEPEAPPAGPFALLSMGYHTACALRADSDAEPALACWTAGWFPEHATEVDTPAQLDAASAIALSVDWAWACILDAAGTPECWYPGDGERYDVGVTPPLTSIDCAEDGCCGVSEDGELACWSFGSHWDQFDPPGSYDASPGPVSD